MINNFDKDHLMIKIKEKFKNSTDRFGWIISKVDIVSARAAALRRRTY